MGYISAVFHIILLGIATAFTSSTTPSIAIILGTRPDVIKLSVLISDLKFRWQNRLNVLVINTGQHKEMLTPMLDLFSIHPDITLDFISFNSSIKDNSNSNINSNGIGSFVSKAIAELGETLELISPKPVLLVVQGDTNTALVGGMLAFYSRIPLVHLEAGLRSWEVHQAPYPEEFNRRVLGLVCRLCLAPTELAKQALIKDGTSADNVFLVGNTVIDAVRLVLRTSLTSTSTDLLRGLSGRYGVYIDSSTAQLMFRSSTGRLDWVPDSDSSAQDAPVVRTRYVLVSTHRRENQADGIQQILQAVGDLADQFNGRDAGGGNRLVFFVLTHMNPGVLDRIVNSNVEMEIYSEGASDAHGDSGGNIVLLPPIDYAPFVRLLRGAEAVITDSGGLQEESAVLGVPCVVLREATERMEGVLARTAVLVPQLRRESIRETAAAVLTNRLSRRPRGDNGTGETGLYGDGYAAARTSCLIGRYLGLTDSDSNRNSGGNRNSSSAPSASEIVYYPERGAASDWDKLHCGSRLLSRDYRHASAAGAGASLSRHIIAPDLVKREAVRAEAGAEGGSPPSGPPTRIEMLERRAVDRFRSQSLSDPVTSLFNPYQDPSTPRSRSEYTPSDGDGVTDTASETADARDKLPASGSVSVILTQYRRNTTEAQIRAIFRQSLMYNGVTDPFAYTEACNTGATHRQQYMSGELPRTPAIASIVIYQNEQHVDLSFLADIDFEEEARTMVGGDSSGGGDRPGGDGVLARKRRKRDSGNDTGNGARAPALHPLVRVVHSAHDNHKYHGRFTLPLLSDTEFTAVLDDDTIPQPYWLQHAVAHCMEHDAIVGGVGVVIGRDKQYYFNPPVDGTLEVDYVGHSWVFRTKWVSQYLFNGGVSTKGQYFQPSWEAGEDVGFSSSAWLGGRVRTILPPMSDSTYSCWGDSVSIHHKDGKQTYSKPIPGKIRWPLTRYWIEHGYVPVALRDQLIGESRLPVACVDMGVFCPAVYNSIFPRPDLDSDGDSDSVANVGVEMHKDVHVPVTDHVTDLYYVDTFKTRQAALRAFVTAAFDPPMVVFGSMDGNPHEKHLSGERVHVDVQAEEDIQSGIEIDDHKAKPTSMTSKSKLKSKSKSKSKKKSKKKSKNN